MLIFVFCRLVKNKINKRCTFFIGPAAFLFYIVYGWDDGHKSTIYRRHFSLRYLPFENMPVGNSYTRIAIGTPLIPVNYPFDYSKFYCKNQKCIFHGHQSTSSLRKSPNSRCGNRKKHRFLRTRKCNNSSRNRPYLLWERGLLLRVIPPIKGHIFHSDICLFLKKRGRVVASLCEKKQTTYCTLGKSCNIHDAKIGLRGYGRNVHQMIAFRKSLFPRPFYRYGTKAPYRLDILRVNMVHDILLCCCFLYCFFLFQWRVRRVGREVTPLS